MLAFLLIDETPPPPDAKSGAAAHAPLGRSGKSLNRKLQIVRLAVRKHRNRPRRTVKGMRMAVQPIPFVDIAAQHRALRAQLDAAIRGVLDGGAFILGPDVAAFEQAFAAYCGTRHCVGVSSGTSALRLALAALDIGAGDEVIVPANTFIASALSVSQTGATPVLVDVDDTYLMNAAAVEAAITARTKAIMPVHLFGRMADMEPLLALAQRHDLSVVEDACQAHGAIRGGRRAGSYGRINAFSFYPGKNLGACGDAGAVTTDDDELADRVRVARDIGQRRKYEHVVKGDNCRLDTLQAALLLVKLDHLEAWNASRIAAARAYDERLRAAGFDVPARPKDGSDVYHLYAIEADDRDGLRAALASQGIESGIHYPTPIHLQPAYADLGLRAGAFPRTEAAAARLLSLPMFPSITDEQISLVVEVLAGRRTGTPVRFDAPAWAVGPLPASVSET
jgi:dTDP-4-amino-4,6-dideoxygalactose transaminase